MKRILISILVGICLLSLIGCAQQAQVQEDQATEKFQEESVDSTTQEVEQTQEEQTQSYSKNIGPEDAKAVVRVFTDFQEPLSAAFADLNPELVATLQTANEDWQPALPLLIEMAKEDKIRLEFKHLPLAGHEDAYLAAQAAEAANQQGKFWQYHDLLLENQEKLKKQDLINYATQLNLDIEKFKYNLDFESYAANIQRDIKEGQDMDVIGVPTIIVNGKVIEGTESYTTIEERIDKELNK